MVVCIGVNYTEGFFTLFIHWRQNIRNVSTMQSNATPPHTAVPKMSIQFNQLLSDMLNIRSFTKVRQSIAGPRFWIALVYMCS